METEEVKNVLLIVAHPDDETLWAGGTILSHPSWNCYTICVTRKSDKERAAKFYKALKVLLSDGIMGDLDDGPDQKKLNNIEIEQVIIELMPPGHFDLVITHHPTGEYTRHRRHEEVSKAVIRLWLSGKIDADVLWTFAYEDGNKGYYPKAIEDASHFQLLAGDVWLRKYKIITETYGFEKNSWEAMTTPPTEAFWQLKNKINSNKIPVSEFSCKPKRIMWVLASPVFDSIWPLKTKIYNNEIPMCKGLVRGC